MGMRRNARRLGGPAGSGYRRGMFTRLSPTTRLLLAAALAYVAVPLTFYLLWNPSLLPSMAAGGWLALFFLFVPLPTPRPLARVGATLVALLAGLAAPPIAFLAAFWILIETSEGPFLVQDSPPSSETALEAAAALTVVSLPWLLVGLGLGATCWALHRTLDPRLRGWRVGWAWLAPAAWASLVPPWTMILLGMSAGIPIATHPSASAFAYVSIAILPHLLAQIALARRLAATAPVGMTPTA